MKSSRFVIRFLLVASLFAILFSDTTAAAETRRPAAERPNVVVFLVDDMGVMDTSVPFLTDASGSPKTHPLNEYYRTPSMERLARQGIRFNQFYAMSVCSPTRISIMTGQNAARHRATNWINPTRNNGGEFGPADWDWEGLGPEDVTLPGLLAEEGFTTIHVGKGHFGPKGKPGSEPLNLGFQVNVGGAAFGAPGSYYGAQNYGWGTKRESHAVPHLEQYHGTETFLSEALTIEANRRVDAAVTAGSPFFLYMAHYAVHAPFHSDPRFAEHYTESGKPKNAQAFATLIEGMDKSLGDLMDHLEELGVAEKTLILFLGDNGTDAPLGQQHQVACAAPLRGKKGSHYEGGMRVPFIAAWAKVDPEEEMQQRFRIPKNAVQPQMANVTDLLPTILQVTDVSPSKKVVDGQSLVKLLGGESDSEHRQQFLMHYPHGRHRSNYFTVYRDEDWKLIFHALPQEKTNTGDIQYSNGHFELFNLSEDPFEQNDLSATETNRVRALAQAMEAELTRHSALSPVDKTGRELYPSTFLD
ncbi:MAG: sulfatase-like hydrolase/transferase [Pirellulaceae bacterium]